MTALIYKAALPTYSSAEDLAANAGENLLLNETGTAYELEPAQGGASVVGLGDRAVWVRGVGDEDNVSGSFDFIADLRDTLGDSITYDDSVDWVNAWGYPVPVVTVDGVYSMGSRW